MMVKKIRKNFMKLLAGLLLFILASGIAIFYSTMHQIYLSQMEQIHNDTAMQIKASYELVLEQIQEQAKLLNIYDQEIVSLAQSRQSSVLTEIKLYKALNSVALGSQYIHSVYLYSQKEDRYFDSLRGNSFAADQFHDQAVKEAVLTGYRSSVDPHPVKNSEAGMDMIYSLFVSLPGSSGEAYLLSLNIDMSKLYRGIMKRNGAVGGNSVLYIYNEENRIISTLDQEALFSDIGAIKERTRNQIGRSLVGDLFRKDRIVEADVHSAGLGWHFYLQVPFVKDLSGMYNSYFLAVTVLLVLAVIFGISYLVLRFTTRPIDTLLDYYDEKRLKDLLTSNYQADDKDQADAESFRQMFSYERFRVVVIEAEEGAVQWVQPLKRHLDEVLIPDRQNICRFLAVSDTRLALVLNYQQESEWNLFYNQVLQQFRKVLQRSGRKSWMGISLVKADIQELHAAYQECAQIMDYKLSLSESICCYDSLAAYQHRIPYPRQHEKQLINNLLLANIDGSIYYMEKFLDTLFDRGTVISDIQIRNYLYQLQNEMLKHLSSLPISVKMPDQMNLEQAGNREEIEKLFLTMVQGICREINRKDEKNESVLLQSIVEYIDSHLADSDFNLNGLSYQFNLNRNYLARLIKEHTQYSFNDYVNNRKIAKAKQLLTDKSKTVEQVAKQVGFSYAHYFIKVFKNNEGVTPGQYREMTSHNNNAVR